MDYFPDSQTVLIQLTDSVAMEAAISKREHQIGNELILVTPITIEHWYPPNISILNDDCFGFIFEKLPLSDLSVVAEVCTRFKTIAKQVFAKKFAHFDSSKGCYNGTETNSSENVGNSSKEFSVTMMKRVFRNFGCIMQSLYVNNQFNDTKYNDLIVKLMTMYCSGKDTMLTKLTLDDFEMDNLSASTLQKMKLIFKRLTFLGISYGSHHKDLSQLLSDCSELTEFILMEVPCFDDFLKYKCEKLVTVRLRGVVKDKTIELLARTNSQIKILVIDNIRVGITAQIFSVVGNMLPALEKLAILHGITMNTSEKNAKKKIRHLASLKHLNNLTLYSYGLPVADIIDALNKGEVPIQNLIMSSFELDSKAADSISKMTELELLQLNKVRVNSDQLVKIVKNAPVLESLYLIKSGQITLADIKAIAKISNKLTKLAVVNTKKYVFGEDDYKEIAGFVENRGNRTKLNISGLTSYRLKASNGLVEANLNWLEIRGLWPKGFEMFNGNDESFDSTETDADDEEEDEDSESEFSGIEDFYYALTSDADRAGGNDPLNFIHEFSQKQRKMESVLILRAAHEMGISKQFGAE